jgi:outer membrane protein assembly factor BamB
VLCGFGALLAALGGCGSRPATRSAVPTRPEQTPTDPSTATPRPTETAPATPEPTESPTPSPTPDPLAAWTRRFDAAVGAPVVRQDGVTVGLDGEHEVRHLDAADGTDRWRQSLAKPPLASAWIGSHLYVGTGVRGAIGRAGAGRLHRLDDEGARLWATAPVAALPGGHRRRYLTLDPLAADDERLYAVTRRADDASGPDAELLYALDLADGTVAWAVPVSSRCAFGRRLDGSVLVGASAEWGLTSLSPGDGTVRWARDGRPIARRGAGRLLVTRAGSEPGTGAGRTAFLARGGGSRPSRLEALDARTGDLRWWAVPPGDADRSGADDGYPVVDGAAAIADDALVWTAGGCRTGAVVATAIDDGRERWSVRFDAVVVDATVHEGRVLVSTTPGPDADRGTIHALDPATGAARLTWSLRSVVGVPAFLGAAGDLLAVASSAGTVETGTGTGRRRRLAVLDPTRGTVRWTRRFRTDAAVTVDDGRAYVAENVPIEAETRTGTGTGTGTDTRVGTLRAFDLDATA